MLVLVTIDFYFMDRKNISRNIIFVFDIRKSHRGLEQHEEMSGESSF